MRFFMHYILLTSPRTLHCIVKYFRSQKAKPLCKPLFPKQTLSDIFLQFKDLVNSEVKIQLSSAQQCSS